MLIYIFIILSCIISYYLLILLSSTHNILMMFDFFLRRGATEQKDLRIAALEELVIQKDTKISVLRHTKGRQERLISQYERTESSAGQRDDPYYNLIGQQKVLLDNMIYKNQDLEDSERKGKIEREGLEKSLEQSRDAHQREIENGVRMVDDERAIAEARDAQWWADEAQWRKELTN